MRFRKHLNAGLILMSVALAGISLASGATPQAPASAPDSTSENPLQLTPDHVTISVADIDKTADWYVQVLGFKEVARFATDEFKHRQLSIPGYRIDLSWRKGSARHTVGAPSDLEQGWRHIVFKTPDPERTLQRLHARKAEVKVDRDTKTSAITQMFILDPEGNEIELQ